MLLFLALLGFNFTAVADPYQRAGLALSLGRDQLVPLDDAQRARVQAHFESLYAAVKLPGEGPAPTVILILPEDPTGLAHVRPDFPGLIFWNARFFASGPGRDVERYVMAHELGHFDAANVALLSTREREYHADVDAITARLFRLGQRDARGEPAAAAIDVKALIDWLRTLRPHENYLDPGAMISGLKVLYATEYMRRPFPPPTPGGAADLRAEVAAATDALTAPARPARPDRPANADAALTAARLGGDLVKVLELLNAKRQSLPRGTSDEHAALVIELADVVLNLRAQLGRQNADLRQVQIFDALAPLSPLFFREWAGLIDRCAADATLTEDALLELRAEAADLDLFHVAGLDHRDAPEVGLIAALARTSLAPDDVTFALGGSRLMHHLTPRLDELRLDGAPLTLFYLAGVLGQARAWQAARPRGPQSATLGAFVAALRPWLGRPEFTDRLAAALLERITTAGPGAKTLRNVSLLLGRVDLDRDFPGLRETLSRDLPADPAYAPLRLRLNPNLHGQYAGYLRDLAARAPREFVRALMDLRETSPAEFRAQGLDELWLEHLEKSRPGYFADLGAAVERLGVDLPDSTLSDDIMILSFQRQMAFNRDLQRWSRALTALAKPDPNLFIMRAMLDPPNQKSSRLFTLIDWRAVFADLSAERFEELASVAGPLLRHVHPSFVGIRAALLERTLALVEAAPGDAALTAGALRVLNDGATITPAGQELLHVLVERLRADRTVAGLTRLLDFLKATNVMNFTDAREFADLFADATVDRIAAGGRVFHELPPEELGALVQEAHRRFDAPTARRISERWARGARADLAHRALFEAPVAPARTPTRAGAAVFWNALVNELTRDELVRLDQVLRTNAHLTSDEAAQLQIRLISINCPVRNRNVERELRARYAGLDDALKDAFFGTPEDHLPLAGSQVVAHLRRSIARLPTAATRARVLDSAALAIRNERSVVLVDDDATWTSGVDQFHQLYQMLTGLSEAHVLSLIETFGSGAPLDANLRRELHVRLITRRIVVPAELVERYLVTQFRALTPLHRAGVFQLLLEGGDKLIERPAFRQRVFARLLARLPDARTRATFLDVWEAGLAALPTELRSLVLAIVMSESGAVGSPEHALVTLLSHLGPIEQKFGQALAFADLPESYRRALRQLWDGAQELDWFQAQELIKVQIGDIGGAGYRLARILNSGSTVVYLEIEHRVTGERLVVSVFRDGVHQAVKVGAHQLRTFARELVKKNPARYGFLPLLVEDSVRTMRLELDPAYKRRVTRLMAEAYRRAALRLGHVVDAAGVITANGFTFATVGERTFTLADGRVVTAERLATGRPMRALQDTDPDRYDALTDTLLGLEAEVLRDPTAPVDKDRMPGQNVFDETLGRNFILDHGQAARLSPAVHAKFIGFTRHAFAADVEKLNQTLTELTGVAVLPAVDDLRRAEPGVRPLAYLGAVAPAFLALDEDDPRQTIFFELLHGVRAELRLLQWEESEGANVLGRAARRETLAETSVVSLALDWLTGRARGLLDGARAVAASGAALARLEAAFHAAEPPPVDCDARLGGTAANND